MFFMNNKPGKQMPVQAVRPCVVITKRQPAVWQAHERAQGNDNLHTP